jgi:hypothetical protein
MAPDAREPCMTIVDPLAALPTPALLPLGLRDELCDCLCGQIGGTVCGERLRQEL